MGSIKFGLGLGGTGNLTLGIAGSVDLLGLVWLYCRFDSAGLLVCFKLFQFFGIEHGDLPIWGFFVPNANSSFIGVAF